MPSGLSDLSHLDPLRHQMPPGGSRHVVITTPPGNLWEQTSQGHQAAQGDRFHTADGHRHV